MHSTLDLSSKCGAWGLEGTVKGIRVQDIKPLESVVHLNGILNGLVKPNRFCVVAPISMDHCEEVSEKVFGAHLRPQA